MANSKMTINDQLAIECPECHIQVMVPIVVTLKGGMTREAFIDTQPDLADLWAHMWTHNVLPRDPIIECHVNGEKHHFKLLEEDYLFHVHAMGETYLVFECVKCHGQCFQLYSDHIRMWTKGV